MKIIQFNIDNQNSGIRIDKFLAENLSEVTRSAIIKLLDTENILLNNQKPNKKTILKPGDVIEVTIPKVKELKAEAEDIPLSVIYEDEYIIVIDKPKGMVVHPATGNYTKTLVNALLFHCADSLSGINGILRPGIVHRIDKNTSGLLAVAKNDLAHQNLAEQLENHTMKRKYIAIVRGNIKQDMGEISAPIGRHHIDRKKMTVTDKNSKSAITHYKVLERFLTHTYVQCELETGRTHQIRVHMAHIGHPIAGDDVYAGNTNKRIINLEKNLQGQCLHALELALTHPKTLESLTFVSKIPDYFSKMLNILK